MLRTQVGSDMASLEGESMHWKAYIYWSIILWIILSIVASAMMKKQDDPSFYMLWKILYEFTLTSILLIIGLGMVLDYGDLLKWFGEHLSWRPPAFGFRIFGCFVLLVSLVFLATSIMDLCIVLGILPNLYDQ